MNIEFTPADQIPVTKENILLNEKVIGTIQKATDTGRFMAAIPLGDSLSRSVCYGHGDDKESAITNALVKGNKELKEAVGELFKLADALGVPLN